GGGGLVSLGASGSAGGSGGSASINHTVDGTVRTRGTNAHALFAQSVGGGGGAGGANGGAVSIGGSGSGGGNAGSVQVSNAGMLVTTGVDARGIFAQSVGGGGGAGGGGNGLFSIGGSGAAGGQGGSVNVSNQFSGTIETSQLGADAIFAQSV